MQSIIKMYAALEVAPVKISYPKGQPSANADYKVLDQYKQHHDFITIYDFGPYTLTQTVGHTGCYQTLRFHEKDTDGFQEVRCDGHAWKLGDLMLLDLFAAIKNKATGKRYINPLETKINDYIAWLKFYAHEANPILPNADAIMKDLDKIRFKLLASQNINYKTRNK